MISEDGPLPALFFVTASARLGQLWERGEGFVDPVVFAVRDVVEGVPLAIGRNGRFNDRSKRGWCAIPVRSIVSNSALWAILRCTDDVGLVFRHSRQQCGHHVMFVFQ